jgi:hypothetical protein
MSDPARAMSMVQAKATEIYDMVQTIVGLKPVPKSTAENIIGWLVSLSCTASGDGEWAVWGKQTSFSWRLSGSGTDRHLPIKTP